MKIALGYDHTASLLKDAVMEYLTTRKDVTVTDFGASPEYPEGALAVAKSIAAGEHELGILLCGTGAGMSIAANKVRGIRAVACSEPYTAKLTREHNNTHIICIGARVVGTELAKMVVAAFLDAVPEGGRHAKRVETFMAYEANTN
ncbi:MAG: ribose 5-phosphate isomerase B [Defluviitaleaceae bacterium]|nr:ribose 5-phosphate isomerase B [Defluviitaleaceae bacterium]